MNNAIRIIGFVKNYMDYIKSIIYDRGLDIMLYEPDIGAHAIYPKFVINILVDNHRSESVLNAISEYKLLFDPEVITMYPKRENPKEFLRLRIIKDEGSTTIPEGSTLK